MSFAHTVIGTKLFLNWINVDWRDECVDYRYLIAVFLCLDSKHFEVFKTCFLHGTV